MHDDAPRLTDDQVAAFHRDGFLIVQDLTTTDDIQAITGMLDGLMARLDQLPKELVIDLGDSRRQTATMSIPQINMVTTIEPRLTQTRYYRNAYHIARQLLGPQAMLRFEHSIYKPPHNGQATPWHQDLSYPVRSSGNRRLVQYGCNFWLPLQDTSVEMGCMQFIPHSHLGDLLPHRSADGSANGHTLMTDDADASRAVACPLTAGGATIHQPKTLHYTGPNMTDRARRAWILFFGCPLAV